VHWISSLSLSLSLLSYSVVTGWDSYLDTYLSYSIYYIGSDPAKAESAESHCWKAITMGCKPSTLRQGVNGANSDYSKVFAIGQTERQLSKMQRATMNMGDKKPNAKPSAVVDGDEQPQTSSVERPKLDSQGYLLPEEVARRTFSSITNQKATLGTRDNKTQVEVSSFLKCPDHDPSVLDECGAQLSSVRFSQSVSQITHLFVPFIIFVFHLGLVYSLPPGPNEATIQMILTK
jgi:hypothetical protein